MNGFSLVFGGLEVDMHPVGARTSALRFHGRDLMLPVPEGFDPRGVWADAGAIVGPVGNRFTAAADLPGWAGPTDGRVVLHGDHDADQAGTQHMTWKVLSQGARHARFAVDLAAGHGDFTAARRIEAHYTLPRANVLRLELTASTDGPTLMTPTHHPYWALGPETGTKDHRLQIRANHVLPIDDQTRPTGEVMPVAGSEFDFNIPRALIPADPPLDNTFCLSNVRVTDERAVAYLEARDGWAMELWTTEPGLVVFDGRITDGFGLEPYAGCCLEPQSWPDAPRHTRFPSVTLAPDETFRSVIEYRFKVGSGRMRETGTSYGL